MPNVDCLPLQTLKEYLAGWTDASQSEQIEAHLAQCSICEETIASIDPEPDSLAAMIGTAASVPVDEASLLQNALIKAGELIESNQVELGDASAAPLATRSQIGPYLLLKPLGSGGMGSVFLARHQQLGKQVAIKLLPMRLSRRDHFEARFQREIRTAGGLDHPSIVSSTDAGQDQGTHYLVMEYIDGVDLSQLARACGKLELADACELVRQVALGLSHAHAAGVVHRDIKPSNLMLNRRGQAKILDFGLARLGPWNEFSAELTTVGQLMGTLDYMAPEQAERAEAVDYRADIYSLGATLFRLLCGRAPLAASPDQSPLAKLRLLATQDPPLLSTLRDDVPQDLVELVRQMLARDPNDRPASAAHVAQRLEEFCNTHQLTNLIERAIAVRAAENMQPDQAMPLNASPLSLLPLVAVPASSQQNQPLSISRNSLPVAEGVGGRKRRWPWIGLACLMLVVAVYSGITIWLDGQQGWLHIQSDAKVSVELVSGDKTVKQWRIEPGENSTRLYAGKYRIVLEQGSDGVEIDRDQLLVLKGGLAVARIVKSKVNSEKIDSSDLPPGLETVSAIVIPPASTAELVPGDALILRSPSDDKLKHSFVVQADHTVKLPLVGTMSVQGMTLSQFETKAERCYLTVMKEPVIDILRDYSKGPDARQNTIPPASTAQLVPGDALHMQSLNSNDLAYSFRIQADSTVKTPWLKKVISVNGMNVDTFERHINELYGDFLKDPRIEVYRDYTSVVQRPSLASNDIHRSNEPISKDEYHRKPETLFKGRPLSEWMSVIPLERDLGGISDALDAVRAATTDDTKQVVGEFLIRELPQLNWQHLGNTSADVLFKRAFAVLQSTIPDQYYPYLRQQLDRSTDESWKNQIFKSALLEFATPSEMAEVHAWIQEHVFSKPSPYLEAVSKYYLNRALTDSTGDEEFWMKSLLDCSVVDDLFWLRSVPQNTSTKSESYWTEIIRRAIRVLADSEAAPESIVYACVALRSCPAELSTKLIDAQHTMQLKEIWIFRAKQFAKSEELRQTQVSIPLPRVAQRSDRFERSFFSNSRVWTNRSLAKTGDDKISVMFALAASIGYLGETPEELTEVLIPEAAQALHLDPWTMTIAEINGKFYLTSRSFSGVRSRIGFSEGDYPYCALSTLEQLYDLVDREALKVNKRVLSPFATRFLIEYQKICAQSLFSEIEQDEDGKLSYEEAVKLPELSLELCDSLDLNQDQSITMDEYIKFRQARMKPELDLTSASRPTSVPSTDLGGRGFSEADLAWSKKAIAKYDRDSDEKLSIDEQAKMLIKPSGADINNDGFVDAEEYATFRAK